MPDTETKTGAIKWFNDARGYGFIQRDDKRDDIFCHVSQIANQETPHVGDRVSFIEDQRRDGRLCARRVVIAA